MRKIRAYGPSMFPSIPSGSELFITEGARERTGIGDIICYLSAEGELVAHRVVKVSQSIEKSYLTQGDTAPDLTWIPEHAILGVVAEVNWHGVRYRTDGCLGRFFKQRFTRRNTLFYRFNLATFYSLRAIKRLLGGRRRQPGSVSSV